MSAPEHNGGPNPNTMFKALAYGLSGSNFVCVIQFLFDPRVPAWALALLIGSMPPLIVLGVLFGIFETGKAPHPDPVINAEITAISAFVVAASASMMGFGKLFWDVNPALAVALGAGIVCALGVMMLVNYVLKRGGSA